MYNKPLKPQDVLVLLKLVVAGHQPWTLSSLAESLGMSASEVLHALKRSEAARLYAIESRELRVEPLLELLTHALKYFFPAQTGKTVQGVGTGSFLPELKGEFPDQFAWVWPDSDGISRGPSIQPLYPSVPFAAKQDVALYLLLALVDLIRCEDFGQREQAAHALEKHLRDFYSEKRAPPEEQAVLANLSDLGAPLVLSQEAALTKHPIPKEETLSAALALAHRNASLARALPVVFYKQQQTLNFRRLRRLAQNLHEDQALGFFLDLTAELSGEPRLSQLAKPLRKKCPKASIDFFVNGGHGKYARQLAESKTPQVARNWGFRMNMEMDSFRSHFVKFVD